MEPSTQQRASLVELYRDHQGKTSDKWESYLSLYDALFDAYRDRPVRLLEIGAQNGGSLDIWGKFFPKAELILGCDINKDCNDLSYDDERISLLIGDANDAETFEEVLKSSKQFDIIIDDGSHTSEDIIKSFSLYFPTVANDGLYIVEDMHCSYWAEYEGGIEAPHSSMNFFKRVSDLVNRQHWGMDIPPSDCLSFYQEALGIKFDEASLDCILDVRFSNSVVAVSKGKPRENEIGRRVAVGETAAVWPAALEMNGRNIESPDETQNPYGPVSPRLEVAVAQRSEAQLAFEKVKEQRAEIDRLNADINRLNAEINRVNAEINRLNEGINDLLGILRDARNRPLKQFKRQIIFKLQTFLARPFVPLPQRLKSRLAAGAARRDPDRSDF